MELGQKYFRFFFSLGSLVFQTMYSANLKTVVIAHNFCSNP